MPMGIPVKLKKGGFVYMGEEFDKGEVFNAPHETMASFMCDQEKRATRVNESDCEPEQVGTNKRVLILKGDNVQQGNRASYDTKVMNPSGSSNGKPVTTKNKSSRKASSATTGKSTSKSNVKAVSDASTKDT